MRLGHSDEGSDQPAAARMAGADVQAALATWRDGLVNLSGTNRLINFRRTKTGEVEIIDATPASVVGLLRAGTPCIFRGTGEAEEAEGGEDTAPAPHRAVSPSSGLLSTGLPDKAMATRLRHLLRRSKQEYLDRGVSVLYMSAGMLCWRDEDEAAYTSPMLLVPVELVSAGPRDVPQLRARDDDPVVNPALSLRLRQMGVDLPTPDATLAELDISALWSRVATAISEHKSWYVNETMILSCFTFHKEAMYRDLQENEDRVLGHPIIRALATKDHNAQTDTFAFDPITADGIDHAAPPEDIPLVLDADSSQRACIAAAAAGHSFVMDGPPGTGKSQTIANMIGCLLHAGKRVLFVSEKAAALEVVRNRLSEIGLDNYLLELHSHKASRKEVATSLAAALDNVPVAPGGMDPVDRRTLRERREQLNGFADAMNRVREPLGYSLHDVLGVCATLVAAPAAPTPEIGLAQLTPESLRQVRDSADQLRRAWRPAVQRDTFLWRDVIDRNPLDGRLYQAQNALQGLTEIVRFNAEMVDAFGLSRPADAATLAELIAQAAQRPAYVSDSWLTVPNFHPILQAVEDVSRQLAEIRQTAQAVRSRSGVAWHLLPAPGALPDIPDLDHLRPGAVSLQELTAPDAERLAAQFAGDSDRLELHQQSLNGVTTQLGLPDAVTFAAAARIAGIAELANHPHKPEPFWFDTGVLAAARTAAETLRRSIENLAAAETVARRYFTEAVLSNPVEELADRFTAHHRGLRKLLAPYRRDKETVAALAAPAVTTADALAHLADAAAWKRAVDDFIALERQHAAILGRYWQRLATDFTAVHQAFQTADEVLRVTPPDSLTAMIEHVCSPTVNTTLIRLATDARDELLRWQATLRPAPELTARFELSLGTIAAAVTWLRAHLEPLAAAVDYIRTFNSCTGGDLTLSESMTLARLRQAASDAEDAFTPKAAVYAATLAAGYRGTDTDEKPLTAAVEWAAQARRTMSGADTPLTAEQAQALSECRITEALPGKISDWRAARQRVVDAFASKRHADIETELDDYDTVRDFLHDLREDSSGQDEWFSHLAAREVLARFGLDAAVDFCADQQVTADQIRPVIERALFRAWADTMIRSDDRLHPIRAEERDHLVAEYQRLDNTLVTAAVGQIITAVNSRRPSASAVGEPALIRREGMKKTRHLAVRQLISQARNAVQALKPCFMMSPLAVSQFLPPDINFDVVIFDEASQVTPADAINCVYRGTALITAGDDKQLPPTSFFDRLADADDDEDAATDVTDFQSILELSKACGAFRNLGLTWHYRSRHEALIAFSNHAFYRGRLITFPGANAEGPDVGVELIYVDGVYRRGTSRDNPIEAEKVAERVIHHYTTRHDLSLGVVTFSVAQADAIENAVDRALNTRPDLQRFFDDDRLHGFFVKSLESVQGDERDVMLFSIGYGFDELNKISTNFGALNRPKGWRRLNVAITRARQRIEVISSIHTRDIPDTTNESIRHLTAYLDYAERGMAALALQLGDDNRDTESPFEESVLDTIRSWGFTVQPQVGAAGYRIDLAVRHPAYPGEVYAIGVECDGAMYHSSPSARDRDRLREQVLRGLGWNLHRIWGTAWYRHRPEEERRLRAAIDTAITAPVAGRLSQSPLPRPTVVTAEVQVDQTPGWAQPYRKAELEPLPAWASPSDYNTRKLMVPALEQIAIVEGPIHITTALQRVREAWNIGRVGQQIRATIEAAISDSYVCWDGTFLDATGDQAPNVRYPANGVTRTVDQIADSELQLAMTHLIRDGGTVNRDELLTATARLFGWARRGSDINTRLNSMIEELIVGNQIHLRPEGLTVANG